MAGRARLVSSARIGRSRNPEEAPKSSRCAPCCVALEADHGATTTIVRPRDRHIEQPEQPREHNQATQQNRMTISRFSGASLWLFAVAVVLCGSAARADDEYVTCGSAIKLTHYESKTQTNQEHYLSSEGKNLGSGSGQQIVTAVTNPSTTNTLWLVRPPNDPAFREANGQPAACGAVAEPIPCGSTLRLSHLTTNKNLHSHAVKSPLSRQQEVSGFGEGDGRGDNGDDWKVLCKGQYWERGSMVSLQHVDSGKYLGASSTVKFTHQNCGHNCPILNHLEVFGRTSKDSYGSWIVESGVHLSR